MRNLVNPLGAVAGLACLAAVLLVCVFAPLAARSRPAVVEPGPQRGLVRAEPPAPAGGQRPVVPGGPGRGRPVRAPQPAGRD